MSVRRPHRAQSRTLGTLERAVCAPILVEMQLLSTMLPAKHYGQ